MMKSKGIFNYKIKPLSQIKFSKVKTFGMS